MSSDGQAQIRYRLPEGRVREWGVGANTDTDTEDSMRYHLKRWFPNAEYLGVCITRVKTGEVVLDTRREV